MMKNFATAIMLAIGAYAEMVKPNQSGEMHTKQAFMYGRFKASIRASNAKGTGSAFFLLNLEEDGEEDVFDEWNAITIVPSLAHDSVLMTKMSEEMLQEDWEGYKDYTNDGLYHEYEIEWTPEYLSYRVDGQLIRRKEQVDGLDKPQNLGMSICVLNHEEAGEGWDDSEVPYYTRVDYVEVHTYYPEQKAFELTFRDEFDSYDPERWGKADGKTWHEMDSTFVKQNAYVEQGRLQLKLDKNPNYQDGGDGSDGDGGDGSDGDGDHTGDDDHSDEEPDEPDFHVLPAPKNGTLDAAIEKATRVAVTMVRNQLNMFSEYMGREYSKK